MAEWTESFLRALAHEDPSFCTGRFGGVGETFDVRVSWDDATSQAQARIDRRGKLPSPLLAPIELTFTRDEDPRTAAVAVAVLARFS